jgi:hypothetical protein
MPTVTVSVDENLKHRMEDHPEINWSEVARQSFQQKLSELGKLDLMNELLEDSQLTDDDVDELAALVNDGALERLRDEEDRTRDSEADASLTEDA